MDTLAGSLAALGFAPGSLVQLAGDASQRQFFRMTLADRSTVVAAWYPQGSEAQVRRDSAVQRWGNARGLPIPRAVGEHGLLTVSEDLGDEDLERAALAGRSGLLDLAIATLAEFQRCEWHDLPTPPFDAAFFRRELAVFEEHAVPSDAAGTSEIARFLDDLARRVAGHPYRLVHRDYHVNNLLLRDGRAWAVDFQDMRGGPDTYDLVSLLRERAGAALVADEERWRVEAAARFAWTPGWPERYWECAAQRGLKVIGTFMRLAAAGRRSYLGYLPAVIDRAAEALAVLAAPAPLRELLAAGLGSRAL